MAFFDKYGVEYSDDRKTLVRCPEKFSGEYIIPENVDKICSGAFDNCAEISSIIIPEGIKRIEATTFFACTHLKEITLPKSITYIGEEAFGCCDSLTSIIVPVGVTEIATRAFENCFNLTSISLPTTLTSVGCKIFEYCDSLKQILVPKSFKWELLFMFGKEEFEKYKELVVECDALNTKKRTWGELEQLWFDMYREFEKQEGQVPSVMPPFGVCLTTEEYAQYKSEGRDFKKIHAWCWSGQEMHATMRMHLNAPSMAEIGEPIVGPLTPRIGIYKVVRMDSDSLYCYYIGKDIRDEDNNFDFLEEIVEINPSPLYNYYSKGPKDYDIVTGDIIIVTDNQLKQLHLSEGKTYSITWRFGNPKI